MTAYFIRRFLLIIPTFIGITFIAYMIMQFVPGGPLDQMIMQMTQAQAMEGGGGSGGIGGGGEMITQEMRDTMAEALGLDKPPLLRYFYWLGNLLQGDMGRSTKHPDPVLQTIISRFPVSVYFGLIGFTLSYLVCIPLGVWKAIKHGGMFDATSSILVFIGYSIPGWALGAVLLVMLGGGSCPPFWDVVPLGGFRSPPEIWEEFSLWEKIVDQGKHTILPVIAYMVASFASLTILMKNSLMENLGMDYVRTAFAKGVPEKRVIFVHALRNSLIPIATGLGHLLSLVLAGSYLIEKVFNINGMGLLGFESILGRDYPVAMGILVFASVLRLLGNIISDMLYAIIDPRIRFS